MLPCCLRSFSCVTHVQCKLTHACVSFAEKQRLHQCQVRGSRTQIASAAVVDCSVKCSQYTAKDRRFSDCNLLVDLLCGCRFFAGYRVRPDGIHFVMHADGRPSGMAFVEFDCPQEAMRALVRP